MADFFNIPFGVRVAGSDPIDGDRYIASTIAQRNLLVTNGRADNGQQVYVLSNQTLYILTDKTIPVWQVVGSGSGSTEVLYESKVADFAAYNNGRYSLEAPLEVGFSADEGNWYEFLIKDVAITFDWDTGGAPTIPPLVLNHYYRVSFVGGVWNMADLSSSGGGTPTGLEALDEGNGIGWRLIGRDPANYGDIGLNAVDLSYNDNASTTRGATGEASFAEGANNSAQGFASHAEGSNSLAQADYSHAEGSSTADGVSSHAEGYGSMNGDGNAYATATAHVEAYAYIKAESGYYSYASHAEGEAYILNSPYAHSEGGSRVENAIYGHAEGEQSSALARAAHAEGSFTTASGEKSHSQGDQTVASGISSFSFGYLSVASGNYSLSGPNACLASGISSVALGLSAFATADGAMALGTGASAEGVNSVAIGINSSAEAEDSIAIGLDSKVNSGNKNIAIGYGVWANQVEGPNQLPQVCIGRYNQNGDQNNVLEVGIGDSDISKKNGLAVRSDGIVTAPSATIALIGSTTQPRALITKEYADANYTGGGGGSFIGSGNTASRPPAAGETTGHYYFDTDLGYPIWVSGANYVNATGTIV